MGCKREKRRQREREKGGIRKEWRKEGRKEGSLGVSEGGRNRGERVTGNGGKEMKDGRERRER